MLFENSLMRSAEEVALLDVGAKAATEAATRSDTRTRNMICNRTCIRWVLSL